MNEAITIGEAFAAAEYAVEIELYEEANIIYNLILKTTQIQNGIIRSADLLIWGNNWELH